MTCNCPMCVVKGHSADKRKRFGLKVDGTAIAVNCFNCNFSTMWKPGMKLSKEMVSLLKQVGVQDTDIKAIQFEIFKEASAPASQISTGSSLQLKGLLASRWKETPLPDDARSILSYLESNTSDNMVLAVAEYAVSRNLLDIANLYVCENTHPYRLVIPMFYKGKIVGHTARLIYPPPSSSVPKYLSTYTDDFLYNIDHQYSYERKFIILCEGLIDAYHCDGVAALRGTLNTEQIEYLNRLDKKIILVPDMDKGGSELVDIAIKNKWMVSIPPWGRGIKDISDAMKQYGKILTMRSIFQYAMSDTFEIQLKHKMLQIPEVF